MLNIDKNKKYVLACSGGSDSMALLSMFKDYDIVAAHLNYHLRKSSDRDQRIVEDFCLENGIRLEVQDVKEKPDTNLEKWARDLRYGFFKDLSNKYECEAVLVAHHLDDNLETYLIQKDRGSIPLYWGINEVSEYEGLKIYRPLLDYSKQDLVDYCKINSIEYGVDETNFDTKYKRNRIRKELSEYSEEKKRKLLDTIKTENKKLRKFYGNIHDAIKCFDPFEYEKYISFDDALRYETLRRYLIINGIDARHFTVKKLESLDAVLKNGKNYLKRMGDRLFDYSYGNLKIVSADTDYSIVFDKYKQVSEKYFKTRKNGKGIEAVTVSEKDYPLTIRNYQTGDSIKLRFGHKQINRFFIDRKISLSDRQSWPVVLNKENRIILVPGIGCDVDHYSKKPNMYVTTEK